MVASLRLFLLSDEHAVRFCMTKGSASKTTRVEVPYYGEAIEELHAPKLHVGSLVALYVSGEQVPSMFVVGMFVNDRNSSEPLVLTRGRGQVSTHLHRSWQALMITHIFGVCPHAITITIVTTLAFVVISMRRMKAS